MTDPINTILDHYGTLVLWILGYMIELSCLYIPVGHCFINAVWLLSSDEYVRNIYFERKSTFKNGLDIVSPAAIYVL